MTAQEIDAHPDADRIWATILKMREDITYGMGINRDPHSGEFPGMR